MGFRCVFRTHSTGNRRANRSAEVRWAAVYLSAVNEQRQRALKLLADIEAYLGKRAQ